MKRIIQIAASCAAITGLWPITAAEAESAVNSQIEDSVTQTNVKVLGDAPSLAMGQLFQETAQAGLEEAPNQGVAPLIEGLPNASAIAVIFSNGETVQ